MNLTTDVLREHHGNLVVDVKVQNKMMREVLISNESKDPLLYAITFFYNLTNPVLLEIWKEINISLIGETIKSKGYVINKTNGSYSKMVGADRLVNINGGNSQNYDVVTYDLMIQISNDSSLRFARIFEIMIVNHLKNKFKYEGVDIISSDEMWSLLRNAYQKVNIKKDFIKFC